jgi:two-component system, cell cycle sensor histidine kinase and response regulator CckA
MIRKLHILVFEDREADADLALHELRRGDLAFVARKVVTEFDFMEQLEAFHPDLILAGYGLSACDGLAALEIARLRRPEAPFIFLSSLPGEGVALEALRRGAADFIPRPRLATLGAAVRRALAGAAQRPAPAADEPGTRAQAAWLESARDAIFVVGLDGRARYWNPAAERLYGWTREEALAGDLIKLLGAAGAPSPREIKNHLLQQGEWRGQLRHKRRDGAELLVNSRCSLVRDGEGNPDAVLAIHAEATPEECARELATRAQCARSAWRAAVEVARRLKPVWPAILEGLPDLRAQIYQAEAVATVDGMIASACQGAGMLQRILACEEAEASPAGAILPRLLLEETAANLRPLFSKTIVIQVKAPEDLPAFTGVAGQLRQLMLNLCLNAREAMPKGGKLTLSARRITLEAESARRQFPPAHPGDYVELAVADTGAGITPEQREHLFEPFFTTKDGPARGLGLAAAYAIIRHHQGCVQVESVPGEGAKFLVRLPLAAPAAAGVDEKAAPAPRAAAVETILCAEDEDGVRRLVQLALVKAGYEVIAARHGAEALALFEQHRSRIHVVLTDINMPIKDGWRLITDIRRLDPAVRIVVMTGRLNEETHHKARHFGVREVVEKPLGICDIARVLRRVLQEPAGVSRPTWTAAGPGASQRPEAEA